MAGQGWGSHWSDLPRGLVYTQGSLFPTQQSGVVIYNGSLQQYISRLATASAGVAFETNRGQVNFRNMAQSAASTFVAGPSGPSNAGANLVTPQRYRLLRDRTRIYRRAGFVRNRARLIEQSVVTSAAREVVAVTRVIAPSLPDTTGAYVQYAFVDNPQIVGVRAGRRRRSCGS